VSKGENFRLTDFRYFCATKPLWVGNFWAKLKKLLASHSNTEKTHTGNSKQIFPEKEMLGLSPNLHIHVSVSDFYIPKIGLPIQLQEK
jgi:hypothetical protein